MDKNDDLWVEYYVIFEKSSLDHWIMKWLDPYFQHCYAVKLSDGGQIWTVISPKHGYIETDTKMVSEYPTIRSLCGRDTTILKIKAKIGDSLKTRFWILNCVEVVKSLLGIYKSSIITPKHLYKYLIREGKTCQTLRK